MTTLGPLAGYWPNTFRLGRRAGFCWCHQQMSRSIQHFSMLMNECSLYSRRTLDRLSCDLDRALIPLSMRIVSTEYWEV